jgi:hypothetical protein
MIYLRGMYIVGFVIQPGLIHTFGFDVIEYESHFIGRGTIFMN